MINLTALFGSPTPGVGSQIEFRAFPKVGPDRWLLETRYRVPWHLATWPRTNLRGRLIYSLARVLSLLHIHLPSRRLHIEVADDSPYAVLRRDFGRLGIFLGTPGPNRKVVVFAERSDRSVFVKIPLSEHTAAMLANEAAALTALAKNRRIAPMVPRFGYEAGHLAVENIARAGARYGTLPIAEVVRVHELLFAHNNEMVSVAKLRALWSAENDRLSGFGPTSDHSPDILHLLAEVRDATKVFLDGCDPEYPVPCYTAHGDFTRWNVLVGRDGRALVIDWELYGQRPKFFDIIHYIVSASILVERREAENILKQLLACAQGPRKSVLVAASEWHFHIGLYFAYQAGYYYAVYTNQPELHPQAVWQLKTWRDALMQISAWRIP